MKKKKVAAKRGIQVLQYRFSKNITPEKFEALREKIDKLLQKEAIPEADFIAQGNCSIAASVLGPASSIAASCDCSS